MEKLIIIAGLLPISMILFKEWKRVKAAEEIDPEVERFRFIENLDQDEVTATLVAMRQEDLKSLLYVLTNKSEQTENNRRLAELVQFCINN